MCDFISWKENPNNKDDIAYLTDADVFSKHGKEVFADCRDNDVIGHGAIEKFYPVTKGWINREHRDFWEYDKLPKDLAEKVKLFPGVWSKMFSGGYFQNDDLRLIICYGPNKYNVLAWKQLLKQKPDNYDLRCIIEYGTTKYKALAWKQLLKQKPDNDDLHCIIKYGPAKYKALAWKMLNERN